MATTTRMTSADEVSEPHSTAQAITRAARDAFAEKGYDRASVAEIARRVGIVEGAVYRHFPSKRDLLHQVIRSFYEPLVESTTAGASAIEWPVDRVRYLIRRGLQALTDDRLGCRLIISEARTFDDYYESEIADLSRRYTSLMVDAVRDGIHRGDFRPDTNPQLVRDLVYGGIEHMAWGAITGHGDFELDLTARQLTDLVLAGITSPPPSTTADPTSRLEAVADRLEAVLTSTPTDPEQP
ncbi:MAG: TetR/AcrR family transcriptional regulator [Actinomycetia bacterium]|nr:TetR/AcrR family transcriptional regulator [Actinomycetes bacterium]MCP4084554.1 TetR/AcrR family transcriptional regulator [Actinomycetes bacterium]